MGARLEAIKPTREWSAAKPSSQASQLPQFDRVFPGEIGRCQGAFAGKPCSYSLNEYIRERLVGCQDAFAGKPCSYKIKTKSRAAYTAPLFTTHQAER